MDKKNKITLEDYELGLRERLKDPQYAAKYIEDASSNGTLKDFILAVNDVARAIGITHVAKKAKINRENYYRAFSEDGNVSVKTLHSVLHATGLSLAARPSTAKKAIVTREAVAKKRVAGRVRRRRSVA